MMDKVHCTKYVRSCILCAMIKAYTPDTFFSFRYIIWILDGFLKYFNGTCTEELVYFSLYKAIRETARILQVKCTP